MIANAPGKRCSKCNSMLPLDEFYAKGTLANGVTRYFGKCKQCTIAKASDYQRERAIRKAEEEGRAYKSREQRSVERQERLKRKRIEQERRQIERPWEIAISKALSSINAKKCRAERRADDPWESKLESIVCSVNIRRRRARKQGKRERKKRALATFNDAMKHAAKRLKCELDREQRDEWDKKLVSIAHNQRIRMRAYEDKPKKPSCLTRKAGVQMCFDWS